MNEELITFGRNAHFVSALIKRNVEFIIVGGMAVAFHGCRENLDVDDLDVLLNDSPENSSKLSDALRDMFLDAPSDKHFLKPNLQIPIKVDFHLDLITSPSGFIYLDAATRSLTGKLNGSFVQFVSKDDLITLKTIAIQRITDYPNGSKHEISKHQRDLDCLRKI